jgi:hypothetical protein
MSKARLGKPMSEETKRKKSKPILCVETNIVYYGIHEAYMQTGIDDGNIGLCAKGKRKTAGGCRWRYYYESN